MTADVPKVEVYVDPDELKRLHTIEKAATKALEALREHGHSGDLNRKARLRLVKVLEPENPHGVE